MAKAADAMIAARLSGNFQAAPWQTLARAGRKEGRQAGRRCRSATVGYANAKRESVYTSTFAERED